MESAKVVALSINGFVVKIGRPLKTAYLIHKLKL
jgi:hypothetical protein